MTQDRFASKASRSRLPPSSPPGTVPGHLPTLAVPVGRLLRSPVSAYGLGHRASLAATLRPLSAASRSASWLAPLTGWRGSLLRFGGGPGVVPGPARPKGVASPPPRRGGHTRAAAARFARSSQCPLCGPPLDTGGRPLLPPVVPPSTPFPVDGVRQWFTCHLPDIAV
jgi:hypothetical protein